MLKSGKKLAKLRESLNPVASREGLAPFVN